MCARILSVGLLVGCGLVAPLRLAAQAECDPGIEFYPAGPFRSCTLAANRRVGLPDGGRVYCRHGETIELHPNGVLRVCTLDRALSIQGQPCPQGSEIQFSPLGQPEHCFD